MITAYSLTGVDDGDGSSNWWGPHETAGFQLAPFFHVMTRGWMLRTLLSTRLPGANHKLLNARHHNYTHSGISQLSGISRSNQNTLAMAESKEPWKGEEEEEEEELDETVSSVHFHNEQS
jgi:hypothetical protein